MKSEVKYPNIKVQLTGKDGNAFAVIGRVSEALKKGGVPLAERDEFFGEATKGDYNHLLITCMKWVKVT